MGAIYDFWYPAVTIYLASIYGMAFYHKKEAEYEDWNGYELSFFDWIPFVNTCMLFVLCPNILYDRYLMQKRMVRRAKSIIEKDNKEEHGSF